MVASELTASAKAMGTAVIAGDAGPSKPLQAIRNRASSSRSPYVRDQAGSSVAWQLLDDEAVERARKENKLVFLHIGYKACHCKLLRCRRFASLCVLLILFAQCL